MFYVSDFINSEITGRSSSMFEDDLTKHAEEMSSNISGKKLLVIGGAGTIGSSFIRAMLKFNPSALFVLTMTRTD